MRQRYLEVTFRRGQPVAAYLTLPRTPGARVARTTDEGHGVRVDFDDDGAPVGIEITAPSATSPEEIDALLIRLGQQPLEREEWAPLHAA